MNDLATKKQVMDVLFPYFAQDEKMVLLVGDMGFSVLDQYFEQFPNRVFNVGIAEQAMVGMAAGMWLAGLKPIVYAQIPFLVMRAFEQVRYDICEHNLGVIMVGVGADNYFKALGRSHCMDSDDIKMMEILPHLQILSTNQEQVAQALHARFNNHPSPPPRYILGVYSEKEFSKDSLSRTHSATFNTLFESCSFANSTFEGGFGVEVACA